MGALVVVRVPAPAPCPSVLLAHAGLDDRPFALVSGAGDAALAGWSYAALEPVGRVEGLSDAARAISGWMEPDPREGLPPFAGGAVGYTSYDLGWRYPLKPRPPRPDPLGAPQEVHHLYDAVYARCAATKEGFLLCQPTAEAEARLLRLQGALRRARAIPSGGLVGSLAPAVPRRTHERRVEQALELIRAGEIYQVNLTYPLLGRFRGAPEAAFARVVAAPPPFAAFLRVADDASVVSASPECFFELDARTRTIGVYPIKGTRPRAASPTADAALAAELAADPKERAEHLMIVDLLRNDLGRVAEIGSVSVDRLAYLESFPSVHHLTTRITARLPLHVGLEQVLRALFPGGSITGVPKLRAMEVIDALEDLPRGVYTGSIAYVTPGGSVRASIAIRTAQIAHGEVRFGVGGGIVADSVPAREWDETEVKAQALGRALDR